MLYRDIYYYFEGKLATFAYVFPLMDASYYFAGSFYFSTKSRPFIEFYMKNIIPLSQFYEKNIYFLFGILIALFIFCSRRGGPLSKFTRYNIIQAILLDIIITCFGQVYFLVPNFLRETLIGNMFSSGIYLLIMIYLIYAALLILGGKCPKLPLISQGARMQIQDGYSGENEFF